MSWWTISWYTARLSVFPAFAFHAHSPQATGGTAQGAITLVKKCGATLVELHCQIELIELQGQKKLGGAPFYSIWSY